MTRDDLIFALDGYERLVQAIENDRNSEAMREFLAVLPPEFLAVNLMFACSEVGLHRQEMGLPTGFFRDTLLHAAEDDDE